MFVIFVVFKWWIYFIFPMLIYFNIWSFILSLSTNSLSEPHVSEHVTPSIGRKVTVGDAGGLQLTVGNDDTVGNSVGGDEWVKVGGDVVAI